MLLEKWKFLCLSLQCLKVVWGLDHCIFFEFIMSEKMSLGISVALTTHHAQVVMSCNCISFISQGLSSDYYQLF
jgi:hypothetical protein